MLTEMRCSLCSGGCELGRSAHTQRDIYIFTQPYNTLARMLPDFRSLHACSAPPHTHTRARARKRTIEASIRIHVYIQRGKGQCRCALDIYRPRCRGSSMALEHRCVSIGDPSTYILIHIATCARTRAHTHRRRRRAQRPRMRRRPTERSPPRCVPTESGAYVGQVGDGGGVPRADVRVEGRRRVERLRAENATLSEHT